MSKKGINVLSFFDGMSAGQEALRRLDVRVNTYIAIEIDENVKKITKKNFPNTIFYGDINNILDNEEFYLSLPHIDIVFAGSPCQGFSKAGKGGGLDDPRSALFFVFIQILEQLRVRQNNPHIPFFFENVVMNDYWADIISRKLGGYQPARLDAIHYSCVKRDRLYWTNLAIPEWLKNKYTTKYAGTYEDIMSSPIDRSNMIPRFPNLVKVNHKYQSYTHATKSQLSLDGYWWNKMRNDGSGSHKRSQSYRVFKTNSKMCTFLAEGGGWGAKAGLYLRQKGSAPKGVLVIRQKFICVKPTIETCCDALGFRRSYCKGVLIANEQKRKSIGNSWSVIMVMLLINNYATHRGWC